MASEERKINYILRRIDFYSYFIIGLLFILSTSQWLKKDNPYLILAGTMAVLFGANITINSIFTLRLYDKIENERKYLESIINRNNKQ